MLVYNIDVSVGERRTIQAFMMTSLHVQREAAAIHPGTGSVSSQDDFFRIQSGNIKLGSVLRCIWAIMLEFTITTTKMQSLRRIPVSRMKLLKNYSTRSLSSRGVAFYGSSLSAADYMGQFAIAELLLDRGADVNVRVGSYGTAHHSASLMGH